MTVVQESEFQGITIPMDVRYKFATGAYLQKFLEGLREGEIYANRCSGCGRLQLPPREVCGRCHVEMGEYVQLGLTGYLLSWSLVSDPIYDPAIGDFRPGPYACASVVMDGGPDVALCHYLSTTDISGLKVGLRMEVVFRPKKERQGLITDIACFKPIKE